MKRHLLFKSLLLLYALIVGSTSVWADSYTITFANSANSASGISTSTNASTTIAEGSRGYVTTQPYSSISGNCYYGGSTDAEKASIRVGKSGNDASITISLSNTGKVKATSIVLNCMKMSGNKNSSATISANGMTAQSAPASAGDLTFTFANATDIENIVLSSVTAVFVYSITVNYTTGGGGSEPSISLSSNSIDATVAEKNGTINVTYNNLTEYSSEVFFCESDGTTSATYDWLEAEINSTDITKLDYAIDANTGAARTAYMRVYVVDNNSNEYYSPIITITQAAKTYPVVTTLDFTDAGWGFPSNYDESEKSYTNEGYSITINAPTGHKALKSGEDIVALIFGSSGATLTLPAFGFNVSKIKVYGNSTASTKTTFNIFVGDDAVSTEVTSSKVDHEFVIAANKQAVGTIYTIKVTNSNNCQISKIEVFGNGCEAGLVQSYGWATYIPTVDVEYPANTAYVVSNASVAGGLTLEEVTQVPANTPLLLKGEGAKTAIKLDAAPSAPSSNLLEVSDGSALPSGFYPYVLAKNGESACFKQWTGAMSFLNGRVMLVLDETAAARGIFELDDDATGIKQVETSKQNAEGFYNLAGQRVAQPTKGLYIVNGKKVIIK